MDISKSIRIALARDNRKQIWLAEQMDVSPAYAGRLVNGTASPGSRTIEKLAAVFGMPVSEFIALGES